MKKSNVSFPVSILLFFSISILLVFSVAFSESAEPAFAKSNYWLNAILLTQPNLALRDKILGSLHEDEVYARPACTLMHALPMFESCPSMDVTMAKNIEARMIQLPSSANL